MTKRFISIAAGVVALAAGGSGFAADLPVKAPPKVAPPAFSWTGCYVGAEVGAPSDSQQAFITGSAAGNQAAVNGAFLGDTFSAGVYGGCNWQIGSTWPLASNWVVGAEGDFTWIEKLKDLTTAPNLFANGTPVGAGGITWTADRHQQLPSVRGRLGYALIPNVLLYGTAGVAWERSDFAGVDAGLVSSLGVTFSQRQQGTVVGAGVDWAPWSNGFILRAEFLHYQFSGAISPTISFGPGATHVFTWGNLSIDTARVGASYKFF